MNKTKVEWQEIRHLVVQLKLAQDATTKAVNDFIDMVHDNLTEEERLEMYEILEADEHLGVK